MYQVLMHDKVVNNEESLKTTLVFVTELGCSSIVSGIFRPLSFSIPFQGQSWPCKSQYNWLKKTA